MEDKKHYIGNRGLLSVTAIQHTYYISNLLFLHEKGDPIQIKFFHKHSFFTFTSTKKDLVTLTGSLVIIPLIYYVFFIGSRR
jgi:hypothetical protein